MKTSRFGFALAAFILFGAGSVQAQDALSDVQTIRKDAKQELAESAATAYSVIFDNSGSMEGAKLADAKRAFNWWLASVPPNSVWSVYNFEKQGSVVLPFTLNGQAQAARIINQFQAKQNTPICRTLRLAASRIIDRRKEKPYERHVILLFTDGEENEDKRGTNGVQDDVRAVRRNGIEVVAIGYAGAGDYLRSVASRYYQANDEKALREGLAQVQAEIDVTANIDITPEEMTRLAKMPTAKPTATALPVPAPATSEPSAPSRNATSPMPKTKGNDNGTAKLIVVGVLIFIALRVIIKRAGRR